jgi:hypothetical protein
MPFLNSTGQNSLGVSVFYSLATPWQEIFCQGVAEKFISKVTLLGHQMIYIYTVCMYIVYDDDDDDDDASFDELSKY